MHTTMTNRERTLEEREWALGNGAETRAARTARKRARKAPIVWSTLDKRKRPTRPERRAAWHAMGGNRPTWMDYNV